MSEKIYLAGPCDNENRSLMVRIGKFLREEGFDVYCPFELQIPDAWDMSQEEWSRQVFEADKAAIDECDYFFMVSKGRISSAGTNWEQGYAYARGKRIFVFQIEDVPTSLMTFCGCDIFLNTSEKEILNKIARVVDIMLKTVGLESFLPTWRPRCETVLT